MLFDAANYRSRCAFLQQDQVSHWSTINNRLHSSASATTSDSSLAAVLSPLPATYLLILAFSYHQYTFDNYFYFVNILSTKSEERNYGLFWQLHLFPRFIVVVAWHLIYKLQQQYDHNVQNCSRLCISLTLSVYLFYLLCRLFMCWCLALVCIELFSLMTILASPRRVVYVWCVSASGSSFNMKNSTHFKWRERMQRVHGRRWA